MKRCSKCILPENAPGIKFDTDNICNYCHSHKKIEPKGEEALEKILSEYRNHKGSQYDCILTFSGGRDSSYILHQLVKKHKLRTLCLTSDCGLVTEYAWKNMERATKILGVDHIVIKSDPEKVLKHVHQNIKAWLKRPSLAMIPHFMGGDRTFYKVVSDFAKEKNIPLIVVGTSIGIEGGTLKAGFAGVPKEPFEFNRFDAIHLAFNYFLEYLKNPRYLNGSLVYLIKGWLQQFIFRYPYTTKWLRYYEYKKWDEAEILKTIKKELDWATAPDTVLTWRTDDATSPWYNFLYYSMTGFTENDEVLSNMIREELITRPEALARLAEENKIRYEEVKKYLKMVNIDIDIYGLEKKLQTFREKTYNIKVEQA